MDPDALPATTNDQDALSLSIDDDALSGASVLDLVSASLRADFTDIHAFVESLAVKLEEMLPGLVRVDRRKSGFRGPKLVHTIELSGADETLELRADGGSVETVRQRKSGGITLKTEALELDVWLGEISRLVSEAAAKSERTRQALERMLMGS